MPMKIGKNARNKGSSSRENETKEIGRISRVSSPLSSHINSLVFL